jgi:hypothetical protein
LYPPPLATLSLTHSIKALVAMVVKRSRGVGKGSECTLIVYRAP